MKGKRTSAENHSGMVTVHPNAAAIDVGATMHMAAVGADCTSDPVRSFGTFTGDLHRLADWFAECGVKTVVMESTGVYWIPIFELLDERGVEVFLVNARDAKHVPGRKTDVSDAQWLQRLHSHGLLRASFRPKGEIAELRAYVRQRERLLEYAASHIQHMQKALTEMNLQLHHVVVDITGATGLRIIRAILAGEHNPKMLAQLRDYRCHARYRTRVIDNLHRRAKVFGFVLQVAFHEPALGPVHRRAADIDGDLLVAHARIGGQQNLRPLELARRLLAPAQERPEFIALVFGQGHTITYVHRRLLFGGAVESTDESNVWRTQTRLHAHPRAVSRLHRRLHARQPEAARRSRHPAPLWRHPAFRPPDDSRPRMLGPHPPPTRRATQHQGARATAPATRLGNARQPVKTSVPRY